MTQMQRITRRPPSSIQEERLPSLVLVEYLVKVPVREEEAPSQPAMWFLARQPLEPLEEFIVNQFRRPFPIQNQLLSTKEYGLQTY
jgi:hypothetical protein